ncbi:MAG: hypothetical protein AB7O98_00285 [Hyphomonadaceae bacterium]
MDSEARLMRALQATAAPRRDPAFTLSVIEAAEAERFRREAVLSVLRGAGIAAAAASLLPPVLGWAGQNPGAVGSIALPIAGVLTLVWLARLMARRADTVLGR